MHTPFSRHGQPGDPSRQQYNIPPPPPPPLASSTPTQPSHSIPLPPPPPRPYQGAPTPTVARPAVPPAGWPATWTRQPTYPLPPPPPTNTGGAIQSYNPAFFSQMSSINIPSVPSAPDNQPLTSATYVPMGESFGPGVGIPALNPSSVPRYAEFNNGSPFGHDNSRLEANGTYNNQGSLYSIDTGFGANSNNDHSSPHSRQLFDPGSAIPHKPSSQPTTAIPGNRQLDISSISAPSSASDTSRYWTLDRVLSWLTYHRFSADWRETFKELDMHGNQFFELGKGHGGKGNVGMMHTKIFPQLATQCKKSGTGFDQAREREEAKRLRRLIRNITDNERSLSSKDKTVKGTSGPLFSGAGSDVTNDRSHMGYRGDEKLSTPSTAEDGEGSPGHHMPSSTGSPAIITTFGSGRHLHQKQDSSDTGGRTFFNDTESRPNSELPATRNRSSSSREALANVSPVLGHRTRADSARTIFEKSPQASPPLRHSRLASSGTTGNSNVSSQGRYYNHNPATSSDTNLVSGQTAYPATAQAFGHDIVGGIPAPSDGRRNGSSGRRPSVAESHGRNLSNEGPSSAKEHRGFLGKFMRRRRDDGHNSHEDGHSQSPSSPINVRQHLPTPPFIKSNNHSRDASLDRPASSTKGNAEAEKHQELNHDNGPFASPKKYVFMTPDSWNYRLLDVSGVDSPETLGQLICYNLGIQDPRDMNIFFTSPGQVEHEEPLPDFRWMQIINKADGIGSVKIFIQSPHQVPLSASASIGPALVPSSTASPAVPNAGSPRHTDEVTYQRLTAASPGLSHDLTHGQRPAHGSDKHDASLANGSVETEAEHKAKLEAAAEEHRLEIERKQKAYHEKRKSQLLAAGERNFINFDAPRERESLVPLRRPPPVPSETSTLRMANSLKKKTPDPLRRSWSDMQDSEMRDKVIDETRAMIHETNKKAGIEESFYNAAGFAGSSSNTSRMVANAAQPIVPKSGMELERPLIRNGSQIQRSMTTPFSFGDVRKGPGSSPRSPGFTMSKGNVPFRIPEYEGIFPRVPLADEPLSYDEPAPHTKVPLENGNPQSFSRRQQSSTSTKSSASTITPSSARRQSATMLKRMSTRRSHGPLLDFKEQPITFEETSPVTSEDSDDSDVGLFAVPLKGQNGKKASSPAQEGQSKGRERPSLSLRTPRSSKGLSVHFPEGGEGPSDPSTASASDSKARNLGDHILDSAGPGSITPESPDDVKAFRRQSFASDVWANRPPVEAVVENLDEFFPNVDLDQPMLAEDTDSVPSTPSQDVNVQSTLDRPFDDFTPQPQLASSEDDLSELETAIFRKGIKSVASRNMQRASGLGRTKSIRDVAKGAYGHAPDSRNSSIFGHSRMSTAKTPENILRRKSTKMFGAKIQQLKPDRQSRLFNVDEIPQDTLPTAPKRQATFKWMKGQLIGKGTFGRVYLGMNTTTGELLAVKQVEVPHRQLPGNSTEKDRMKEMVKAMNLEIDTMQDLEHMNIVQYLGCERKEYSISIFLEYISGGSVGSCLRKHGKFEEPVVSSLTRQTLNGLAYLHNKGILHRDLKADNILLDMDGTCKISDFGISKKSDNIYGNDVTNSMQGSVFWMAPEVVRSQGKGYSAKVDIWSLGCVVLEMFAGRRPWSREEAIGAIYKLGSLNEPPPIPDDVSEKITIGALSFMMDCFNVDPADRPTAEILLSLSDFAKLDPNYSFFDTELYQKIKPPS